MKKIVDNWRFLYWDEPIDEVVMEDDVLDVEEEEKKMGDD